MAQANGSSGDSQIDSSQDKLMNNDNFEQIIKGEADRYFNQFKPLYLQSLGAFVLKEYVEKRPQPEQEVHSDFKIREWQDKNRTELFEGLCYMSVSSFATGEFQTWKLCRIKENSDYNIYWKSVEAADEKLGWKLIKTAGYIYDKLDLNRDFRALTASNRNSFVFNCRNVGLMNDFNVEYTFNYNGTLGPQSLSDLCLTCIPNQQPQTEKLWQLRFKSMLEDCTHYAQEMKEESKTERLLREAHSGMEQIHYQFSNDFAADKRPMKQILIDVISAASYYQRILGQLPPQFRQIPRHRDVEEVCQNIRSRTYDLVKDIVNERITTLLEEGDGVEGKMRRVLEKDETKEVFKAREALKSVVQECVQPTARVQSELDLMPYIPELSAQFYNLLLHGLNKLKYVYAYAIPLVDKLPTDPEKRNIFLDKVPRQFCHVRELCEAAYVLEVNEIFEEEFGLFGNHPFNKMPYLKRECTFKCKEMLLTVFHSAVYMLKDLYDKETPRELHKITVFEKMKQYYIEAMKPFIEKMLHYILEKPFKQAMCKELSVENMKAMAASNLPGYIREAFPHMVFQLRNEVMEEFLQSTISKEFEDWMEKRPYKTIL